MLELEAALDDTRLEAGRPAVLRIQVHNAGDDCTELALVAICAPESFTLVSAAPYVRGSLQRSRIDFALPSLLRGECHELTVDVHAREPNDAQIVTSVECAGERHERSVPCSVAGECAFALHANRVELFESEAAAGDVVRGRVILTNTGNAVARVLALESDGDLQDVAFDVRLPCEIAAGERRCVGFEARVAGTAVDGTLQSTRVVLRTADCSADLGASRLLARNHPRLEGTIEPLGCADLAVQPGERVDWCLRLINAGGARADFTIALHVAGGVYLAGSTRIEGAHVLDAGGTSPLWSTDGMRIEGLPRDAGLTLAFATSAESGAAAINVLARARCAGRETLFESPRVRVADGGEVPALPFRIAGVALRRAAAPTPPKVSVEPVRLQRTADGTVDAAMAGYLAGLDGLMRHLWALAVLWADASQDPDRDAQLKVSRVALRSVFDRLAIKLRMPHYPVRADDVLDPSAHDALDACGIGPGSLGQRLADAMPLIASQCDEYPEFAAYRDALRATFEGLRDDAAFIDSLVVPQPVLDARLDAVLERESGVRACL